jgi:cytochrome b
VDIRIATNSTFQAVGTGFCTLANNHRAAQPFPYFTASEMSNSRILIWDLPTRLFHWLLTVGLVTCFAIAQFSDEDSAWFAVHMIIGIVVGFMVVLRVVWGFVGSKYARFGSFLYSPLRVLNYMRGAFTGAEQRHLGHNPSSSYAIFAMLFLTCMAVFTGLMMSFGLEAGEELHEALSYALAAVVAVHVLGVVWYSARQRENITLSMITGTKAGDPDAAIPSSHPIVGVVFLVAVIVITGGLLKNYDQASGQTKLPFLNTVIPLGEGEEGGAVGDD